MAFYKKLFKKILGIIGATSLVLIVIVSFKNEDNKFSISDARVRGISDEIVIEDDLDIDEANEIIRSNQNINKSELSDNNESYEVTKVIDGDTIVVDIGSKKETIRLIGIDAPEIGGGSLDKKCYGKEAEEFAKKILNGASVHLEKDESQSDRDKYGRLLRYAIMENGNIFDKQMISGGLAREYTYRTPYKYQKEFKLAEQEARRAKKGLWNVCYNDNNSGGGENPNSSSSLNDASILGKGNCYCESNKYNCPDFKTRKEAQNLFECCMVKVSKDAHKLDRNNDGQVCESLP